ncbi:hypothetical protein ACI65C_003895 [Semiaphis heraclei]
MSETSFSGNEDANSRTGQKLDFELDFNGKPSMLTLNFIGILFSILVDSIADLQTVLHDHDYCTVTTELNSSCVTETPRPDENVLLSATHSDHDETAIHNDGCNIKKKFSKKDQHAVWQEKRKSKIENAKIKHPFRNIPCPEICKNKCNINILVDQRQQIWSDFWVMDYTSRRSPCLSTVKENRGNKTGVSNLNIDKTSIINHIKMYNPCSSHYRRHNTPNIMFLPRELTVKSMYKDFCLRYGKLFSQETYRGVLKELNISLKSPISDKCEDCTNYANLIENSIDENEIEELTTKLEQHKIKAFQANTMYKEDANINTCSTTKVFSMDLQKILLLPMIPDSKTCFFTSRLIVFNETFASLRPKGKSHCVLWHEAVAGRKAENIADSILSIMREERDALNFIFWADNCTGQNKNWVLFTALISTLNSKHNSIESVTIKYLTKGHTHMSADGVHGNIEKKFKQQETIIKNDPIKGFKLSSLVMVTFFKGSTKMEYYTNFDEAPKELDFLQKKFLKTIIDYEPDKIIEPRGINIEKKNEIVKKLLPLMPNNRKHFWTTLPVSLTSEDLVRTPNFINCYLYIYILSFIKCEQKDCSNTSLH